MELVHYLFSLPDVECFLSQRICQDPLERFFLAVNAKEEGYMTTRMHKNSAKIHKH